MNASFARLLGMRALYRSIVGFGLVLTLMMLAGCSASVDPQPESNDQTVTLYFYSDADIQNATFDTPVPVSRTVSGAGTTEAMDRSLKLLFAGPTAEEKQRSGAETTDDLTALSSLYIGTRMEGGVAYVNFRNTALAVLNGSAAMQTMAKGPIERTLKQFPGVTDVQYEIDGKVFNEWDA
jgi:hypothetical protein